MTEYSVIFDNVSFSYSGSRDFALKEINFKVREGETVLITGPAGAGKTTLCQCINGLIPHYLFGRMKGEITVKGMVTTKTQLSELCYHVGMVFQDPSMQLLCPTVLDEVAFGPENYGLPPDEIRSRVNSCIEQVRLKGLEDRNPHLLSGGEQQACAIAAVMAVRPEIYVLDEPTSNLDPLGSARVLRLILDLARSEKKTMIIVEHKIEDLAPMVDRMVVMDEGRIILDGEPRKVLEEVETLEKIGLKPPQVTLLVSRLKGQGIKFDELPITVDEAIPLISGFLDDFSGRKKFSVGTSTKTRWREERNVIIEVEDLWYTYPRSTVPALRGVNLRVYEGSFMAIIGQNGSGKTTLVKHFNGLLKPTKGRVTVFGIDVSKAKMIDLVRKVGYCHQNPDHQICNTTVRKELEFGPRNLGYPEEDIEKSVKEVSERLELEPFLDENPFSLSMGVRRRVTVASTLAMKPDVLIVDEPTTGQDFKGGKEMMELMKRLNNEGKTVIVITHDMNLVAEYIDRVVVLKEGRVLIDGTVREVFSQVNLLMESFLAPPQITRLAQELAKYGVPEDVLTVDEMCKALSERLAGG